MALFWHHVFATGNSKVDNYDQLLAQIQMFRDKGMGNYRDLLVELAQNPSMIFWLDNNENHKRRRQRELGTGIVGTLQHGTGELHREGRA